MSSSAVRVALRIRPLAAQEQADGKTECVTQLPGVPQVVIGADRAFTFDHVFSPEVGQDGVYDEAVKPLISRFLQGYNATVLAYGAQLIPALLLPLTGSGKTFSMGTGLSAPCTDIETQGVVPRAIGEIWRYLEDRSRTQPGFVYSVDASFLELYNEDLIDLLNPRPGGGGRGPTIREDSHGCMVLVGVERKAVHNSGDVLELLRQGALSRTTASTDMNRTSSRSHAIFTIHLRQQDRRSSALQASDGGVSMTSKMHFVDLAGSERIKRTGAAGDRAKEGISINAGLLALGNVISALGNAASGGGGGGGQPRRAAHVPYRDSKLTRLLQDSLGGNSQTLMLACISPSDDSSQESLNTIRYANRARNIRNKVAVNFDKNSSVELSMLKTEVVRLRGELSKLKLQHRLLSGGEMAPDAELGQRLAEAARVQGENVNLSQQLHAARRRATILEHERDTLRAQVATLGGSVHSTPVLPPGMFSDQDASVDGGAFSDGAQARPNSLFAKGDVLSQSNVLETIDQELSEQAERHEQQIAGVRRHYESKLELARESLAIVQRERDVALQRLENAAQPCSPAAPASSKHSARGARAPSRLRMPSRASATPPLRKTSAADLGGTPRPLTASSEDAVQIRRLQNEIARLRSANQVLGEDARCEAEQLAVQVQQQAKEISRLRRQHTGRRRESHRCSLLGFKENSWSVAKSADGPNDNGPQLLRAAFIKAVLEGELQRCVRARQLLRERDSFLNRQDRLMNKQNDQLLRMQNLDLECDDEHSTSEMARANECIEIIDAELKFLDFKVRDTEAEIAQLVEAAADGDGSTGGEPKMAPAITNLSGLAMRMVEDVVRIDYRAFADFFDGLPPSDATGMAYLFMQDIIEHRLVALRDDQDRTRLGEELQESRRTLLAMQKTALNAALSYERELGNAERKLSSLHLMLPPGVHAPDTETAATRSLAASNELALSDTAHDASMDRSSSSRGSLRAEPVSAPTPGLDRSVYRSVRERGILLRSALLSARSPGPDSEHYASDGDSDDNDDDNDGPPLTRASSDSIYAMLDPKSPALGTSQQPHPASLYGRRLAVDLDDLSLYSDSLGVSGLRLPPESDAGAAFASTADVTDVGEAQPQGETDGQFGYPSESDEYAEHLLEDAMGPGPLYTPTDASGAGTPLEPQLPQHQEIERGYASDGAEVLLAPGTNVFKDADIAERWATMSLSDTEGGLSDGDMDGEIPELYRSGSGEFFRLPNLARKRSSRRRQRFLVRRLPLRRKGPQPAENSPELAWSNGGRCISAQRKNISRPIVPPEMVDYVDRCNPGALHVGNVQPLLASPELFRKLRIPLTNEYQANIASIAQYMSPPPPLPALAEPGAEAASPPQETRGGPTRSSSDTCSAGSPPFTPRAAGKVLLVPGTSHAAGATPASQDTLEERSRSPRSPSSPRRPYAMAFTHRARLSQSFGVGDVCAEAPFKPLPETPVPASASAGPTGAEMAAELPLAGMACYPDDQSPPAPTTPMPGRRSECIDRVGSGRRLSPTERANASLLSMIDAARPTTVAFPAASPPFFDMASPNGPLLLQDIDFGPDKPNDAKLAAKPSRIRRRAQSSFDINLIASPDSAHKKRAGGGGGRRLSRLLNGIGLSSGGGGKPKTQIASPLTPGGMVGPAEMHRDRRYSESPFAAGAGARRGNNGFERRTSNDVMGGNYAV
ncbi:hypothetical protein H4R19_000616 [Coemansia spiralis]|nr:hypothetical protein H4R19_000616 [Coemansia spiralis]